MRISHSFCFLHAQPPTSQVSLPLELAINEDSTTDEESCTSVSSLKILTDGVQEEEAEAENLVSSDDGDDVAEIQGEIESLVDQKFDLADQLADLRDLIEAKRVDLEEMEDEFSSRQTELLAVIAKQEKERDQLGKQVAQMKLQLHVLAATLKERVDGSNNKDIKHSSNGGKFSGILRTLSSDGAVGMNEEKESGMEMQSLRGNNDYSTLESLLQEERSKCLQKQLENEELLRRIEFYQTENTRLALEQAMNKTQPPAFDDEWANIIRRVVLHDDTQSRDELGDNAERMDATEESSRNLLHANNNRRNSSISLCSSLDASEGTEFRPSILDGADEGRVLISNLDQVERVPGCTCTRAPSTFSANPDQVEFYLPKLRLTCSYCRPKDPSAPSSSNEQEEDLGEDPLALSNILREWQVQFLSYMGIHHAMVLVQANARQSGVLAKHMRRWRRKQKLLSVKTKSCMLALHIWARACQTIVRAIQTRRATSTGMVTGGPKQLMPSFLELPLDSSDNRSVSTLGGDTSVRCYLVKDTE
jgi:hypothetical protein